MEIERHRLRQDAVYRQQIFALLLQHYNQAILYYCVTWLEDDPRAEDVTQEVFIRAWEGLAQLRQESSLSTWLFTIAKKRCRREIIKRRRRRGLEKKFWPDIRDHAYDSAMIQQHDRALLHGCVALLPREEWLLLSLWLTEGQSIPAIATVQGVAEATVRRSLGHALERLQRLMQEHGWEEGSGELYRIFQLYHLNLKGRLYSRLNYRTTVEDDGFLWGLLTHSHSHIRALWDIRSMSEDRHPPQELQTKILEHLRRRGSL